jgi:hypothetical protein
VRYAWAAYRKGAFAILGGPLSQEGMDAAAFKEAFIAEVFSRYDGAWTLFGETKTDFMPVGFVFGFYSHPDPRYAPFMIVGDLIWFPWASSRNRIESAVQFFSRGRAGIPMVEYARETDKKFFESIARHGVLRRVGTSHNIYPNEPAAVFETRG